MKADIDDFEDETEATTKLSAIVERAMVTQLVRSYSVRGKKDMTAEKVARHHGLSYLPK